MNYNGTILNAYTDSGGYVGSVTVDKKLGGGGEGDVYSIVDMPNLTALGGRWSKDNTVAKLYFDPMPREDKVTAMLKSQPHNIAWPIAVLRDGSDFVGFLMPLIDFDEYTTWGNFSNKAQREKIAPDFGFDYAFVTAINFANVLKGVHRAGHVIGDLNESNQLVGGDASVFIVDADSAQIKDGQTIYPSLVGKPEYTAPELIGGSLKDKRRTPATDIFAYSVLIWQLLTGGVHPVQGIAPKPNNTPIPDNTTIPQKIKAGFYPALGKRPYGYRPPIASPTSAIPTRVTEIIERGLSTDPSKRPSLNEFVAVFENVGKNMTTCSNNESHHWDKRDSLNCVWCEREAKGLPNPWGNITSEGGGRLQARGQRVLPAKTLKTKSSTPKVKVSAPSVSVVSVPSVPTQQFPKRSQIHQPPAVQPPAVSTSGNLSSSWVNPVATTPTYTPPTPTYTPPTPSYTAPTPTYTPSTPASSYRSPSKVISSAYTGVAVSTINKVEVTDDSGNTEYAGIFTIGKKDPLLLFFGWLLAQPQTFATWWNNKLNPNIIGLVIGFIWSLAGVWAWMAITPIYKFGVVEYFIRFNPDMLWIVNNWVVRGIFGLIPILALFSAIFFTVSGFYVRKLRGNQKTNLQDFKKTVSFSIRSIMVAPIQWLLFIINFLIVSIVALVTKPDKKRIITAVSAVGGLALLLLLGNLNFINPLIFEFVSF